MNCVEMGCIEIRRKTGESSHGIHRVACLAQCPRCFGYKYLLRLRPKVCKDALARGVCNHEGLEAYYSGRNWLDAIMTVDSYYVSMANEAAKIVELYTQVYPIDKRWDGDKLTVKESMGEVIFVEQEFNLPICGGHTLTRRLDIGFKTRQGKLKIGDHKSAARPADRVKKTELEWSLVTQDIIGRNVIAPMYGLEWGGVVLNMLPTAKGAKAKDFVRAELHYTKEFTAELERSIGYWMTVEESVLRGFNEGTLDPWDLAMTGQCFPNGYKCDYQHLCLQGKMALSRFELEPEQIQEGSLG